LLFCGQNSSSQLRFQLGCRFSNLW